jgi:hypothetical protein
MQSDYSVLDDEDLQALWEQHRKNRAVLELQASKHRMAPPINIINELNHAIEKMEAVVLRGEVRTSNNTVPTC